MTTLENLRAEIDVIEINGQVDEHTAFIRTGEHVKQMALDIIDKYAEQEPCDDNRLYIKVYADLEPQEKAEKLYQICEEDELKEVYKELGEYCDIKPCDDAVSRQAVNEIVNDIRDCISVDGYWAILERLKKLPSVRPQEQTGKWIYSDDDNILYDSYWCSECRTYITVDHEKTDDIGFVIEDMDYCPRCGAKMVKPQESEVNNG